MMKYGYDFYIVAGFLAGSILFGRLIPMLFYGKDVEKESEDGNPGTFNAFVCGGVFCGILVLLAAMPAGATTSILAEKYDMEPAFATKMVIFSTLLSLPTICVWSMLL